MINQKTYYFIAGLPRSGSTVLSAILNQNPKFYSGPASPVLRMMYCIEESLSEDEFFHSYPKINQSKEIISNIINHFYSDIENPVIFDKNRSWIGKIDYIKNYITDNVKIIYPVRNISEILTSFITMIRRNPYKEETSKINFIDSQLIKRDILINDANRCNYIMSYEGVLGQSLNEIRRILHSDFFNYVHFVEYDDLVNNPNETLKKIYEFLNEEFYEHDFDNIKNIEYKNDFKVYGVKDLHEVRSTLKSTSVNPKQILSECILEKCKNMEIWRNGLYNH